MHKNQLLKSLMAIVLGLFAGFLLMLSMGYNPVDGYTYLFKGGLMNTQRIGNSIATATPLILTGLSVAFANRTGLFNIGTPGQMLAGGFTVTAIGILVDLPSPILIPLMVICGIIAGALWAAIPGLLKALFNVNEVVSSIMMNWTAYWIVYYMVPQYLKGTTETESAAGCRPHRPRHRPGPGCRTDAHIHSSTCRWPPTWQGYSAYRWRG